MLEVLVIAVDGTRAVAKPVAAPKDALKVGDKVVTPTEAPEKK